ncbi:MAG: hypothetical protein IKU52_05310 [Clostridia bacterium]|nr:hypothetical protein [Clostridia bacterium]
MDKEKRIAENSINENNTEKLAFHKPKHFARKKKGVTFLVILLVLVLLCAMGFGAYKLYGILFKNKGFDDSTAFYFTSNILSEDGGDFEAVGSIDFDIYNYADTLRTSKEKVEDFEIKVTAGGKDITKKVTVTTGERAMEADIRSACNVNIVVPRQYHNKKIDVEVVSKPLQITLKGSFSYEPSWGYEIKDDGNCVELVLFANEDTSLKVEWDEKKLIADSTNPYIEAAGIDSESCTVALAGSMSSSIYFFKTDTEDKFTNNSKAFKISESKKTVKAENKSASKETE